MTRGNGYRDYYPPSKPRDVRGGIKSVSQRGSFGKNWWSKRWIAVLESFSLGTRLSRGRNYARQGQVLSVEIYPGQVTATVQGSRVKPYKVKISIKAFSEAQWKKVVKYMAAQPIYAARLLAGEMPGDIENVFDQAKLSLFPTRVQDLKTDCSCPDWSNPCKHIAAVYYLLGEEFDRNPFLIFKLRGMERDELISLLSETMPVPKDTPLSGPELHLAADTMQLTLPTDTSTFWQGGELPNISDPVEKGSASPLTLLRQVGPFPFWQGKQPLLTVLEPIYERVAASSEDLVAATCGQDWKNQGKHGDEPFAS